MKAKYYTYRNLNYGEHFSTKHLGIVINYLDCAMIKSGTFKVSEAGRDRCLRNKKRNVHAFVVSPEEPTPVSKSSIPNKESLIEVKYNPYRTGAFINTKTGNPIYYSNEIFLMDGRCFVSDK